MTLGRIGLTAVVLVALLAGCRGLRVVDQATTHDVFFGSEQPTPNLTGVKELLQWQYVAGGDQGAGAGLGCDRSPASRHREQAMPPPRWRPSS